MLAVAISLLLGKVGADSLCPNAKTTPLVNRGVNNYVIDSLDLGDSYSIPFPYAIGVCTSHSVVAGGLYYKHTCANGGVQTQQFSDSECSTATGEQTQVSLGTVDQMGYFECSGSNTYVILSMGESTATSCPSSLQTIYAGLHACTDAIDQQLADFTFYCDSNSALLQWYSSLAVNSRQGVVGFGSSESLEGSSTTGGPQHQTTYLNTQSCSSEFYCFDMSITSTCSQLQDLGIWAQFDGCTGQPDTRKGAVQTHISILGVVVAAIVAFLY